MGRERDSCSSRARHPSDGADANVNSPRVDHPCTKPTRAAQRSSLSTFLHVVVDGDDATRRDPSNSRPTKNTPLRIAFPAVYKRPSALMRSRMRLSLAALAALVVTIFTACPTPPPPPPDQVCPD